MVPESVIVPLPALLSEPAPVIQPAVVAAPAPEPVVTPVVTKVAAPLPAPEPVEPKALPADGFGVVRKHGVDYLDWSARFDLIADDS